MTDFMSEQNPKSSLNTEYLTARKQAFTCIDEYIDTTVKTLLRWSSINSGTRNLDGLNAMARELEQQFAPISDQFNALPLPDVEALTDRGEVIQNRHGKMLSFKRRADAPLQVLLLGHMDTVFEQTHAFQQPVWLDNNTLNGPGVADMKGGLLVIYLALKAFELHPLSPKLGWHVAINPDEETGSLASRFLIAEFAQKAHLGLVYEPALADGTLAGDRKGSGNFSLRVRGKSAHAGREFHLGKNAIAALCEIFYRLQQLNSEENSGITLNLGRVSGGGAVNIVPDTAVGHFNVRCENIGQQGFIQSQINKIIDDINSRQGFDVQLFGGFNREPKVANTKTLKLRQWLSEIGSELDIPVYFKPTGGCCDGNNLNAAGLANIDTLGVRGGNIHTDQEFILIDSLAERAKLSFLLLEKFAVNYEEYLKLS